MKIRIERDALADAVAWASRALGNPRTGGNPGIGIEATADRVVFVSYDRESSARAEFEAVVEEEGTCVVPGRLLGDITKTLPGAPVVLNTNGTSIEVECGRSAFSLPTINSGDFPKMSDVPAIIGTISGADLATAVAQVHVAAETNESLVNLTGIQMEFAKGVITLAATDRYRLALRDVSWSPSVTDPDTIALVPAAKLNDIAKGLADCATVEIAVANGGDSTLIGFTGNGRSIATSLLGYKFPPYRDTIPAPGNVVAYIETASLSAALKRVRLVLEDKDKSFVSISLSSDEVSLTAQGVASGVANEAIDATIDGELADEIRFDPNRFIDGLNAVNSPYVKLAFINSNKPVLLTAAKEPGVDLDSGYKYWLMPKPTGR
ncbi:MAG: hypothetical protein RL441_222 [Actinomycetota bacterium]|mgnify:CR=1 FL=1